MPGPDGSWGGIVIWYVMVNHCCFSVANSCPTLCDTMDFSMPSFPVLHYLPGFAQTQVHWVCDAIQLSHPLLPPSPPMSRFFASGGQNIGISATASVLPVNIQGWFPLGLTYLISLQSKGLPRVFSSTTIWKRQSSALSLLYGPAFTSVHDYWKNYSFD